MRNTIIIGWFSGLTALIAMVIGHLGNHDLSWLKNQISTYAAQAPYDAWITAAVVLSCVTMLSVSILVSRHKIIGDHYVVHIVPVIIGAIISGLLVLAYFEETAKTLTILKASGFAAIRFQSFHDAGLLVFFYGAILVVMLLGIFVAVFRKAVRDKLLGSGMIVLGPASFFFMVTSWPKFFGIVGASAGIKQRVALLCLWLAIVLVLALASSDAFRTTDDRDAPKGG